MTPLAWTYLVYLALTTALAIWVGRTLRRSGSVVLVGNADTDPIAVALSHLLVTGFYLINFGVICFLMKTDQSPRDTQSAIELLSNKVGTILVVLGAMHFLLVLMFLSARHQAQKEERETARQAFNDELRLARVQATEPRAEI